MQAILDNALDKKHPRQKDWAELYLKLTAPERPPAVRASRKGKSRSLVDDEPIDLDS